MRRSNQDVEFGQGALSATPQGAEGVVDVAGRRSLFRRRATIVGGAVACLLCAAWIMSQLISFEVYWWHFSFGLADGYMAATWSWYLEYDTRYVAGTPEDGTFALVDATWHDWAISMPLWFSILSMSLLTALARYASRPDKPPGHCIRCGYNLMGAEHRACPECGLRCQNTMNNDIQERIEKIEATIERMTGDDIDRDHWDLDDRLEEADRELHDLNKRRQGDSEYRRSCPPSSTQRIAR